MNFKTHLAAVLSACCLILATTSSVFAQDDSLWLELNFDETVSPTGGSQRDAPNVHFTRDSPAWTPDGHEVAADQPRFVDGVNGKAVFLGTGTTNLLDPALADLDFENDQLPAIITAASGASVSVDRGDSAWRGESAVRVKTARRQYSGIRIPISVAGEVDERGNPALFVFSFYVKQTGSSPAPLIATMIGDAAELSSPRDIPVATDWTRHQVWCFAGDSTSLQVLIGSASADQPAEFLIDGLQLEKKSGAAGSPGSYPYGNDYAPDPWTAGGQSTVVDNYYLQWKDIDFPDAEGSVSVWFKPEFSQDDAQDHPVWSRSHVFYQLTFQNFRQYSFYRRNEGPNAEKKRWGDVRVLRPETLEPGRWHLLTATWSNAQQITRLYFDGELVGETPSLHTSSSERTRTMRIGNWSKAGLNGTLDDLRIYSRVLTPNEIRNSYARIAATLPR